jgi:transcriptional repressor of cell division inhibition gene dicB
MRKADALAHFGSKAAIANALGITRPAVGQWGEVIPYFSALRLEELSEGELHVDADAYDERGRPRGDGE